MIIIEIDYSTIMACAGSARWGRFWSCHKRQKVAKDGSSFVLSGVKEHREYFASSLRKDPLSVWFVRSWSNSWQ